MVCILATVCGCQRWSLSLQHLFTDFFYSLRFTSSSIMTQNATMLSYDGFRIEIEHCHVSYVSFGPHTLEAHILLHLTLVQNTFYVFPFRHLYLPKYAYNAFKFFSFLKVTIDQPDWIFSLFWKNARSNRISNRHDWDDFSLVDAFRKYTGAGDTKKKYTNKWNSMGLNG